MDIAPASGAGDCGFESRVGLSVFFLIIEYETKCTGFRLASLLA